MFENVIISRLVLEAQRLFVIPDCFQLMFYSFVIEFHFRLANYIFVILLQFLVVF